MKHKILQNKIIIIETAIIILMSCVVVCLGIKLRKNTSSLFKYSVSKFEDTKFVNIEPQAKDDNWFLYLWLTKDNTIREVEYKIGEYGLTGRMNPDNVLCSTIDFPYFNETSYFMPYEPSEIPERNLKNVLVYKEFTFQSGKTVGFIIDKEGNASILNNE